MFFITFLFFIQLSSSPYFKRQLLELWKLFWICPFDVKFGHMRIPYEQSIAEKTPWSPFNIYEIQAFMAILYTCKSLR